MCLKKEFFKTKATCRVTFILSKEITKSAEKVQVLGDFNNWDLHTPSIKKNKEGKFETTVELPVGKEYRFRYLVNGSLWMNDNKADKYLPSGIGYSENSIIIL